MLGRGVLIGTLAVSLSALISATPIVPKFEGDYQDSVIAVPDTKPINNSLLTEIKAENFLSLWFIYVLTDNVAIAKGKSILLHVKMLV